MSPSRRLARPSALALCLVGLSALATSQQTASFPPNHPGITYSDYACAHIGPSRASFDRDLAVDWACHLEDMSPGVRATFLVDASQVRFQFQYFYAGFTCGLQRPERVSWEFGLVVDGVRRPTGTRNPLYPMFFGTTPWISLGTSPGTHAITLTWPSGADVDFLGVELKETRTDAAPRLLSAPPRTDPLVTVFGDSITQGLGATHVLNTYPVRLGALMGWRIVNLGFAGRNTVPPDAWLAAGFPAHSGGLTATPELILLAIGSNDFNLIDDVHTKTARFEENYDDWLRQFRSFLPTTPVLCLTPLPRGDEHVILDRTMEEYREAIRRVIELRADPNVYLFEGRDLIGLPPLPDDPLFDSAGLHPTDAGCEQIAQRLVAFNLARNAGFELRPLENCQEIEAPEPYLWNDDGPGASEVVASPNGNRALELSPSGNRTQLVHGLNEGDRVTLSAYGKATVPGNAGRVLLEFLDASGNEVASPVLLGFSQGTWRRLERNATVPAGTVVGRLRLAKGPGPGQFLVDDVALTLQSF